jgi:YggT family protein
MNINPFIILISQIIGLYNLALIIYIVMQWLIHFDIINDNNSFVEKIYNTLQRIIEPFLEKIRKYIPTVFGGIDISPIIAFLLLGFTRNLLFTYFYVR